jgi:hypothetical protein
MRLDRFLRLLPVAAPLILVAACSGDPANEGGGDPFAIETEFSNGARLVNSTFTITARVVDRARTPLPLRLEVTSGKTDVVAIDSVPFAPELQTSTVYARALKADVAGAPLIFSVAGLQDTVIVRVQ